MWKKRRNFFVEMIYTVTFTHRSHRYKCMNKPYWQNDGIIIPWSYHYCSLRHTDKLLDLLLFLLVVLSKTHEHMRYREEYFSYKIIDIKIIWVGDITFYAAPHFPCVTVSYFFINSLLPDTFWTNPVLIFQIALKFIL